MEGAEALFSLLLSNGSCFDSRGPSISPSSLNDSFILRLWLPSSSLPLKILDTAAGADGEDNDDDAVASTAPSSRNESVIAACSSVTSSSAPFARQRPGTVRSITQCGGIPSEQARQKMCFLLVLFFVDLETTVKTDKRRVRRNQKESLLKSSKFLFVTFQGENQNVLLSPVHRVCTKGIMVVTLSHSCRIKAIWHFSSLLLSISTLACHNSNATYKLPVVVAEAVWMAGK